MHRRGRRRSNDRSARNCPRGPRWPRAPEPAGAPSARLPSALASHLVSRPAFRIKYPGATMSGSLSLEVFNSGYKPIPGGPGWDPSQQATWPASTSTLIAGETDAILVDSLLTTAEGKRLAAWVKQSGKTPSLIFITHGHGDHFFR